MRVMLTGGTGFIGSEVLVRLLAAGREVLVTTRRRPGETPSLAARRVRSIVRQLDPAVSTETLAVSFADVAQPGLALSLEGRSWLEGWGGPVHIVHLAADVALDRPHATLWTTNVQGTRNVLDLAGRLAAAGRLARIDHVSTAFVAGDRQDTVSEHELDVGQGFRSGYEQSKLEAELEVARARERAVPVTVYRPSIVVGRPGGDRSPGVLHFLLKIYSLGRFRTMVGDPECTVDAVPVDHVADAMLYLMDRVEACGGTYHLAAGPDRQARVGELAAVCERRLGKGAVRFVDPKRLTNGLSARIMERLVPEVVAYGSAILPYLHRNPTFSVSGAQRHLGPAGLVPPRVESCFEALVRAAAPGGRHAV